MAQSPKTVETSSTTRRETIWRVALICWVLFIWGHSLLSGEQSGSESGFFLTLLRPVFEAFGMTDLDLMHLIIRKCAHFTEYMILGILATRTLRPSVRGPRVALIVFLLLWIGVPCIDETIQSFVPDRGPAVTDALLDMSGFATGFLLTKLVLTLAARRRE